MARKEKTRIFGESTAIHMFVSFLNEDNRGKKFKWSNFAEMCRRCAKVNLHNYIFNPDPTEKEKELAGKAAASWVTDALIESGIYEETKEG